MDINKNSKIYIAGHNGMVGSAITRKFQKEGYSNLLLINNEKLDLTNRSLVNKFLAVEKPDLIVVAAAKVGGIQANNIYRAQFIYENLSIQLNLIHGAHLADINNLIFLGSSCIYPRDCQQPMKEEYLMTGILEDTNEPYAIAKIAGIKLCESYYKQYKRNYFSVMPTNLYGPNDNYNLINSHVLPAIYRKLYIGRLLMEDKWDLLIQNFEFSPIHNINALMNKNQIIKKLADYGIYSSKNNDYIVLWGDGSPMREFLHVDDLAESIFFLINIINAQYLNDKGIAHINIGSSKDLSILSLSKLIKEIIGYEGQIRWDKDRPNGTKRKLMDSSLIKELGWKPAIDLKNGIYNLKKEFLYD